MMFAVVSNVLFLVSSELNLDRQFQEDRPECYGQSRNWNLMRDLLDGRRSEARGRRALSDVHGLKNDVRSASVRPHSTRKIPNEYARSQEITGAAHGRFGLLCGDVSFRAISCHVVTCQMFLRLPQQARGGINERQRSRVCQALCHVPHPCPAAQHGWALHSGRLAAAPL